ncbi:MAG TPA: toll/interleukin-1 receptor domain-containing protein [Burkholderiaceae bacterium]|nr:toll/interleukin-1 receptor domain-containing protein [Burkholderiaceae bacterium]
MKIFISYSSRYRDLVERLRLALLAEGHEAFVDRAELEPGETFDAELREAIENCDLFIFLLSPESVAPASYALAELALAQSRWRHPRGHVLPVKLAPTPIETVPPYVRAVTILEPQGDPVPGIVAAVAHLGPDRRRRRWILLAVVLLAAAIAAGWLWKERARQAAALEQSIASASDLCLGGTYGAGWTRLEELAAAAPKSEALAPARQDCAMAWLRNVRIRADKQTFGDVVDPLMPVLVQGLATAQGERAADLRAHLGWADMLRGRDGDATDPDAHFRRALQDSPGNVYANAMRAHFLAQRNREEEAAAHFATAVASGRDRAFVRELQLAAWMWRAGYSLRALRTVNEMRVQNEPMSAEWRSALWSRLYVANLFSAEDDRAFLAALPGVDQLATFDWLFPKPRSDSEMAQWRYIRAILQLQAGHRQQAIAALEALRAELVAAKQPGRTLDLTQRALLQAGVKKKGP